MFLDIALGNKSAWRILVLLAESPGRGLSMQEIRQFTKLGSKPAVLALSDLEKFSIVSSEKVRRRKIYRLNLAGKFTALLMPVLSEERASLNALPYGFALILREFVRMLLDAVGVEKVYLFGSVAKRTYREDSDLDVAIISDSIGAREKLLISEILERIEKRFGKKIQIHYFTQKEFNAKDPLVQEIELDGVKLV